MKSWSALGVFLAFVPGVAANLSGCLSTTFALENSLTAWHTLELHFSFANFDLQSLSTWRGLNLTAQAFTLSRSMGNLAIQAGVVLQPLGSPRVATWTSQDFQVVASFVSLELSLGNFRLKLTLHTGPAEP